MAASWIRRTYARRIGVRRLVGPHLRRILDVTIAGVAITWLLPVMVLIAISIYLEDGAPIFFSQIRLGIGGRHFRLLKFRKFGPTEGVAGLPLTMANDARLTRVGKILEKTKLDELPQFWNIIKGDMALVGPRPESLKFADCFVGSFKLLLDHKPGIFGPAQVYFRNESAYYRSDEDPEQTYRQILFPTKASLDLRYYNARTLLQDTAWFGRGVAAVAGVSRVCHQARPGVAGQGVSLIGPVPGMRNLQFVDNLAMASVVEDDNNGL